ncbi:unnamed protein product [Symbiodinium natans]|uniref:Uncharacterized protein n=1 Tax=Symbiodinium natans TaxID=878477 RepID=A0A812JAK7_9DINO|nr:unnamed protein product [Symbiodinium natans]
MGRKGPSPGALCGTVFGLLALLVALAISALLVVDLALDRTDSSRRLQTEDDDGVRWYHFTNGGTLWVVILLGHCLGLPLAALYWRCFILPTHEKFLPRDVSIPQELTGKWKYGHWEFFGACGTCVCFLLCPCCTMSEYWYRSGHLHASSRNSPEHVAGCPGWQFFMGCCGFCLLQEAMSCCYVVGLAAGTGGLGFCSEDTEGAGMGSIIPFRQRYGISHDGWQTFMRDCCCWLWCLPCQGTREYRQVMDTLAHWPLQTSGPAPVAMVVGQPVAVGQPVQGQPAPYTSVPKAF